MSYRELRQSRSASPENFFETAQRYTQFLWQKQKPARAILALCRAIYMDPASLPPGSLQPYRAYTWLLKNYRGEGFLGNPRISFLHQATRIPPDQALKVSRAWALWHLTMQVMPELPTDRMVPETPPDHLLLARKLDADGLPDEGGAFLNSLGRPTR
jgi:hypothetical protein